MESPSSAVAAASGGSPLKLDRRDWRLILVSILLAAGSLAVALRYFRLAFPEAAIDFRVTRSQSASLAAQFLAARGLSTRGYQHASRFSYDDSAKVFLEREAGLAGSQNLLGRRVRLWRWENRWFRPLQREELDVAVTPAGQVAGFDHQIPEAAPGASLAPAAAQRAAEQFLTGVMHLNLADLVFVSSSRQVRPHRLDYDFIWRDAAPLARSISAAKSAAAAAGEAAAYLAQAQYRREVVVRGSEVAAYREYLKVPDAWLRSYARLRSKNNTAGVVDTLLIFLLGLALLWVLIDRLRRGDVRWRAALWIGGAGAVLSFLADLNGLSSQRFAYNTTQSYPAFLGQGLVNAALGAFALGVFLALLTAACEPLFRRRLGRQPNLASFLSWRGVRGKTFLRAMILGIALAFFFFAYQTVFYLVANHFGAWAPADVPYDSLLNTRFPWIYVLLGGFFPAIFEEFMFRMGAIPLFEGWLLGRRQPREGSSFRSAALWIAIIAAAFIWGFGHATYPNEPFFIRGLEVGLGGVILGWIYIRFGILTTVVWHYTVDAIYTAMLLLRSPNFYFRFSGAVTALIFALPLAVAAGAYLVTGTFRDEAGARNEVIGTAPAPPAAPPDRSGARFPPPAYAPVRARRWVIGFAAGAAALAIFAAPLASWRRAETFTGTPARALASARAYLRSQGVSTAGYRAVATVGSEVSAPAAHFIFIAGGRAAVVREFTAALPALTWRARFFRPLQKDEYTVVLRPDGRGVIAYSRALPETAPGASPPLAQARALAVAALARAGVDVRGMELVSQRQEALPARVDSHFVWQDPAGSSRNFGPIRYRVAADLAGNQLSAWRPFLYIPEAGLRAYEKSTLAGVLLRFAPTLLYACLSILVLWFLFRFIREREARWRSLLYWGAAGGAALAITFYNRRPELMAAYSTDLPWAAWQVTFYVELLFAIVGGFLVTVALFAPLRLTAPASAALDCAEARRQWARDALLAGLMALLWAAVWDRGQAVVNALLHRFGVIGLPGVAGLDSLVPGLSTLLAAPMRGLWTAALLGIAAPAVVIGWRRRAGRIWVVLGLFVLCVGTLPPVHNLAQLGLAFVLSAAGWGLLGLFVWLFLRGNPLAYISAALLTAWVAPGLAFLAQPPLRYRAAGGVALAAAAVWLLWLARRAVWRAPARDAAAAAGGTP